jgi:hypothetical protein
MKWRFLYYVPNTHVLHGSGEGNSVMRGDGYGDGPGTHSGDGHGNPHPRFALQTSRHAAVIRQPEDPT